MQNETKKKSKFEINFNNPQINFDTKYLKF